MKEKREQGEGLRKFILARIEEKGAIPFSQFMEWCLYHPQFGYYSSGETRIGKDGDYYTSPCVHPLFGGMVAKQLIQMGELLNGEGFEIVEMGGGRGFLCQDILDWTQKYAPRFHEGLNYYLIETSPSLFEEQKMRLSEYDKKGKVFWIDPAVFGEGKPRIRGCLLTNELVDAFPVHLVTVEQGSLKEIYVTQRRGQLEEQEGEPSDPRIVSYFESMGIRLDEGQRAEVNLRALEWMEKAGHFLEEGFVMTVDYGYPAQELYASHRRNGTLLCYYRHQSSENPYERLGEQDITSHVNFTALINKGEEAGLHLTGLVPQYRFLIAMGILRQIDSLGQGLSELNGLKMRLSLMHLIEPEAGMGEVFKVLIQHKGILRPDLEGLRDLNSIPWPISGMKG